jgi:hypothetical protein
MIGDWREGDIFGIGWLAGAWLNAVFFSGWAESREQGMAIRYSKKTNRERIWEGKIEDF